MDKHYDAVSVEKREDSLRAARQLSALLLNFSGDSGSIADQLEGRKEVMLVLLSDLRLKVEAALVDALHD